MSSKINEHIFLYDFLLAKGGAESLGITLLERLEKYDVCVAFSEHQAFSEGERNQLNVIELTQSTTIIGWH